MKLFRQTGRRATEQLATLIPNPLHRELKLPCVTIGTSVRAFVVKAIEEKLARFSGAPQ